MGEAKMTITCPHCGHTISINPASEMGRLTSTKKAASSRENGKKGGRPRKLKGEKRDGDAHFLQPEKL